MLIHMLVWLKITNFQYYNVIDSNFTSGDSGGAQHKERVLPQLFQCGHF